MDVVLQIAAGWLALNAPDVGLEERRPVTTPDQERCSAWTTQYRRLLGHDGAEARLVPLGREMYAWLDGETRWLDRLLADAVPPLVLEFQAPARPDALAQAVLQAPWELLANVPGYLAGDVELRYCPVRRLGRPQGPPALTDHCLGLMFMAAAPRGVAVLNFGAEENAILDATGTLGLDLVVKESGNPDRLAGRLAEVDTMQVLHLSCHGRSQPVPALVLETDEGDPLPMPAAGLIETLQNHRLEMVDPAGVAHGCVLPTDRSWSPRYLIEFDVTSEEHSAGRFRNVQASLAHENPDLLREAAQLWQRYRTADVGEAVETFETSVLEQMVRMKLESPLAATVASLILLRANRLPLLHDWVRNLANWFEARPDGVALWAEQVMRQQPRGVEAALTEAVTYLTQLLWHGLPHTSEGFAYAARLCDTLRRLGGHLRDDARTRLEQLGEHFQTALVSFSPGGLFTTYSGFAPQTDPTTLLGPFAARP
jgi:hypothetical protein